MKTLVYEIVSPIQTNRDLMGRQWSQDNNSSYLQVNT